jgi:hypothetical protein
VGAGFRRAAKVLDRECRLKAYPMSHSAFRQLMSPMLIMKTMKPIIVWHTFRWHPAFEIHWVRRAFRRWPILSCAHRQSISAPNEAMRALA